MNLFFNLYQKTQNSEQNFVPFVYTKITDYIFGT